MPGPIPLPQRSFKRDAPTEATAARLRTLIPCCAACHGPLAGHRYRYIACHPASPANFSSGDNDALDAFVAAVERGDWAALQALQQPGLDRPMLAVYAVACPSRAATGGGTLALLGADRDVALPTKWMCSRTLAPEEFSRLRASCPHCEWILF